MISLSIPTLRLSKLIFMVPAAIVLILMQGCSSKSPKLNLEEPVVNGNDVTLSWEKSSATGFDSYELYRHTNSGLNEENGTLIHVATSIDSITFIDKGLGAGAEYYYRVYHITDKEPSGSNIVKVNIEGVQLIKNGSFEDNDGVTPEHWNVEANELGDSANHVILDASESTDGSVSLKLYHNTEVGCYEQWIDQRVDLDLLEAGAKYSIRFKVRADFDMDDLSIIFRNSEIDIWEYHQLANFQPNTWTDVDFEMVLPNDIGANDPKLTIHFCHAGAHNIWIDQVTMQVAQ